MKIMGSSAALALAAIALAESSAQGKVLVIDDGSRRRPVRQPIKLEESPTYGRFGTIGLNPEEAATVDEEGRKAAQRSEIANWNKQVERKKAEKRAAKRSKAFL